MLRWILPPILLALAVYPFLPKQVGTGISQYHLSSFACVPSLHCQYDHLPSSVLVNLLAKQLTNIETTQHLHIMMFTSILYILNVIIDHMLIKGKLCPSHTGDCL